MNKTMTIVTGAIVGAFMASGAWADELKIGLKSETSSMDPHWQTLIVNIQISRHIFDHLIDSGDSMELKPGLATSWKPISDTTWEFKLREGVKWHDGSPFTADDVVFTWERTDQVPNAPAPFIASGFIEFDSIADFEKGFEAHGEKILADIPNYTNIQPTVQISDIIA